MATKEDERDPHGKDLTDDAIAACAVETIEFPEADAWDDVTELQFEPEKRARLLEEQRGQEAFLAEASRARLDARDEAWQKCFDAHVNAQQGPIKEQARRDLFGANLDYSAALADLRDVQACLAALDQEAVLDVQRTALPEDREAQQEAGETWFLLEYVLLPGPPLGLVLALLVAVVAWSRR